MINVYIGSNECKDNLTKIKDLLDIESYPWSLINHCILKLPLTDEGERYFGRVEKTYTSLEDKLNFAYCQYMEYIKNGDNSKEPILLSFMGMLKHELNMEEDKFDIRLDYNLSFYNSVNTLPKYSVNPRGSVVNGNCLELFSSPDSLFRFIMCDDSYIQVNDDCLI